VGRDGRQPLFGAALLLAAALLMIATGAGFAMTTAFWPLLLIAFVGTMNPTSGDASIFLPLEQAALRRPPSRGGAPRSLRVTALSARSPVRSASSQRRSPI